MMKSIIYTGLAAIFLTGCTPKSETPITLPSAYDVNVQTEDVTAFAVLSYAQWCASCKVLNPKIEKVRADAEMENIVFVKLDYTDKNDADFYAQAKHLGLETAVREYMDGTIKTGRLMLIRPGSASVSDFAAMTHTQAEVRDKLRRIKGP